jgi:hypothetical protein
MEPVRFFCDRQRYRSNQSDRAGPAGQSVGFKFLPMLILSLNSDNLHSELPPKLSYVFCAAYNGNPEVLHKFM